MDDFENLGDMLNFISETAVEEDEVEEPSEPQGLTVKDQLLLLQAQSFLTLFKVYKEMGVEEQQMFDEAAGAFHDPENNYFIKQSALAAVCESLFPEPKTGPEQVTVETKGGKVYQTPCEECSETPTKMVEFKTSNRTEQHYLCDKCEEAARKGVNDHE